MFMKNYINLCCQHENEYAAPYYNITFDEIIRIATNIELLIFFKYI